MSTFGGSPFGWMGGFMFSVIPVIVILGFVTVFGIIIFRAIRGARQWKRNNDSPVLTVDATVVAKREDVRYYHHNSTNDFHHSSSTAYFVTFEVQSGDRMEFSVADRDYGLLAERDRGRLTFQGTRYQGFERTRG